MQTPAPGGIVIEHDADIAKARARHAQRRRPDRRLLVLQEVPNLKLVFRKRAFKPGSGVGLHVQKEDEIYYVLSGRGTMTLDGKTVDITPGTAVLTRTGSSHSLKQVGDEDLVIMINYEVAAQAGGSREMIRAALICHAARASDSGRSSAAPTAMACRPRPACRSPGARRRTSAGRPRSTAAPGRRRSCSAGRSG